VNGRLDRLTWPEVSSLADGSILAVPVGSTEQHGPHLPLGTDSAVAVALAEQRVLGDPTGATAGEGKHLLGDLAADLVAAVEAWRP
jgi:creatinine amidohydrolase